MKKFKPEIELSKRVYIPLELKENCPHCGTECTHDMSMQPLSYPETNKQGGIYICCDDCDEEFEVQYFLSMEIEIQGVKKL